MGREEQVKTLKEVIELEKYLIMAEQKLSTVRGESYGAAPEPPECEIVNRIYPKVESKIKFNYYIAFVPFAVTFVLGMILQNRLIGLSGFLLWWPVIYYFAILKKQRLADEENIRNSEEYKAECARLDVGYDEEQEVKNQEYAAAMQKYDTEILPAYNKEFNVWKIEHEQKVESARSDFEYHKKKLTSIYESSRIVPMQYRTIEALQYIYDMVSTSDYDVTYAINSYDTHRQRILDTERMRIEEARLQEQQLANELADEQNQIAERARKEAKMAAVVGAVQHHNTNKMLKDMTQRRR